jgi:hypothetical protein
LILPSRTRRQQASTRSPPVRSWRGYQPHDDVRVYLDPAGHPFRRFLPG